MIQPPKTEFSIYEEREKLGRAVSNSSRWVALYMDIMLNCSEILLRTERDPFGCFPKFELLLMSQTSVSPCVCIYVWEL